MTVSIQKSGPESSEEYLTPEERKVINDALHRLLAEWESEGRPWELVDLVRAMNTCAVWAKNLLKAQA